MWCLFKRSAAVLSAIFFCVAVTGAGLRAETETAPAVQKAERPALFSLADVVSDIISLRDYEYNYIELYQDGRYVCKNRARANGMETTVSGYYIIDRERHDIRIFQKDGTQYFFISPGEQTFIDNSRLVVSGELSGYFVRFEYRLVQ